MTAADVVAVMEFVDAYTECARYRETRGDDEGWLRRADRLTASRKALQALATDTVDIVAPTLMPVTCVQKVTTKTIQKMEAPWLLHRYGEKVAVLVPYAEYQRWMAAIEGPR